MDTRTKILDLTEAVRAATELGMYTLVTGHFDPFLPAHAMRLAQLEPPLVVLVGEPEAPLLPLSDRVQLVAALRGVAIVVGVPVDLDAAQRNFSMVSEVRLEEEDDERRRSFIERVRSRQALAARE